MYVIVHKYCNWMYKMLEFEVYQIQLCNDFSRQMIRNYYESLVPTVREILLKFNS